MSELDEGLDEILRKYNFDELLDEAKQAILDLMCKLRGCEFEMVQDEMADEDGCVHPVLRKPALNEQKGPCKWCRKEKS